jgi:hypothetical protein
MVKQLGESKGTVYGRKTHHFSGLHSVFPKTELYCNATTTKQLLQQGLACGRESNGVSPLKW